MKRTLLSILVIGVLLLSCGAPTTTEPTQEELDARLKEEAVKADFVELSCNPEANMGKRLYAEGEVGVIIDEGLGPLRSFLLSQEEGEGYGVYHVFYFDLDDGSRLDAPDLSEGDWVIIWGIFDGKDELMTPQIAATIIEKKAKDATLTPAPLPTFEPIVITGSGDKTSPPFTVTTKEWTIDWSYVPDPEYPEMAVFGFFVYPRGETVSYVEAVASTEATSGSTYSYAGAGEYYIKVMAANVRSWEVVISPP